jgi:predicted DCC family thiol-disulfide oxidoreductase YuxK
LWFVDANDLQAMSRWPQVDFRVALEDLQVLDSGGQVAGGYDAALKLFALMPATRWLLPLLKLKPFRPAGRKLYHWVSANRYWLSRRLFRE